MPDRTVVPEILDHLPSDDPRAVRSRRDLRMINSLMGNERWILRSVSRFSEAIPHGISEIGAGDGHLTRRLAEKFPATIIHAYDLSPAPPDLPPNIHWHKGDLFSIDPPPSGGILIANLFLHHFEGDMLRQLGKISENFRALIFSEPARGRFPHLLGNLMHPLVNHVTRHDMHVSIDAGFIPGELPRLMSLSSKRLQIQEHSTWRGSLRMLGWVL